MRAARYRAATMRRGSAFALILVAAGVLGVLVGACGSGSRAHRRLVLDDIGAPAGCSGYGHSGVAGYGVQIAQAFLTRVCADEVGRVANYGVGGSTLQGELLGALQVIPRDAPRQLSIVWWGLNDLADFGPALRAYQAALTMLVSRLRTSPADVHGPGDPALSYLGAWRSYPGEKVVTGPASFTWMSPRGFTGGVVAFASMTRHGFGARYAFSLDGRPAGSWDTRDAAAGPPAPAVSIPGAYRIHVPPGGGQVIRCRISGVVGSANLTGWALESRTPPLIVLVEQPRLVSYRAYSIAGAAFKPDDRQVQALDRVIRAVAASFDDYVIPVDLDPALGRRVRYFLGDRLHPDAAGHRLISELIEHAIARDRHVVR
jgi:hypothetical protein